MPRVVKAVAGAKSAKQKISENGELETAIASPVNGLTKGEEEPLKSGIVKGKARGRGAKREMPAIDEVAEEEQITGKSVARRGKRASSEKSAIVTAETNDKPTGKTLKAKKSDTKKRKSNEVDESEQPEEVAASKEATPKTVAKNATISAGKGRGKPKQTAAAPEAATDNGIDTKPVEKAPAKKRATKKVAKAEENNEPQLSIETVAKKPARGAKKEASLSTEQTATKRKAGKQQEKSAKVEIEESAPTPRKKSKQDVLVEQKKPSAAKKTKGSAKSKKVEKAKENDVDDQLENTEEPAVAEKKPRSRKRAVPVAAPVIDDDDASADENDAVDGAKPAKAKKPKSNGNAAGPLNATATKYNKADFALAPGSDGQPRYNLKISSWNVAGLRSWLKKDGLRFLDFEEPDIFCLQETKCTTDQLPDEAERIPGYHPYWLCMPGGYAGVAIYSKIMPINVEYGIGNAEFDAAGRIITAEYEKFYLINVYVPNSGRKLVNLEPRMRWEQLFQKYVQKLDARKPVVICGDMNVSHQEIDLANPKANTRNAGFTEEERDQMTTLLSLGYVDTFRQLYPDRKGTYTFWTYMGNARARNVGWRLDYFIVSQRFNKRVVDNCMRTQVLGSDHCPITLFLKM